MCAARQNILIFRQICSDKTTLLMRVILIAFNGKVFFQSVLSQERDNLNLQAFVARAFCLFARLPTPLFNNNRERIRVLDPRA